MPGRAWCSCHLALPFGTIGLPLLHFARRECAAFRMLLTTLVVPRGQLRPSERLGVPFCRQAESRSGVLRARRPPLRPLMHIDSPPLRKLRVNKSQIRHVNGVSRRCLMGACFEVVAGADSTNRDFGWVLVPNTKDQQGRPAGTPRGFIGGRALIESSPDPNADAAIPGEA